MKLVTVSSSGLPEGFRVKEFETLAEITASAGSEDAAVGFINKYLRQKSALVEGRSQLSDKLETLGLLPRETKTVEKTTKDDKGVETKTNVTVYAETEGDYIDRFVETASKGTFTIPGVEVNGKAVLAYVQSIANTCGDEDTADENGFLCFVLDAKKTERVAKDKVPAKVYLTAAQKIIDNNNQDKWTKTFTKEKVTFISFTGTDAAANLRNLANAIKAREAARSEREYA